MAKRKDFNPTDQEIAKGKQPVPAEVRTPVLKVGVPEQKTVFFPKNPQTQRSYNFAKHYGQGFDAIVSAMHQTIEIMLSEGKPEASTITNYCWSGIKYFTDYLKIYQAALARDLTLSDVTPDLLKNYIQHLKTRYPEGASAKVKYDQIKSVLVKMQQMAWLDRFDFPKNPFPNSNRKMKGQKAFSKAERKRVVYALKEDVNAILAKNEPLAGYELTLCLLAIAMRSGMNTTPLLEMTTDSIKAHPLKEDRKLLVLYKRRGNSTSIQALRHSKKVENAQTVLADVAVIVEHIIKNNALIRAETGTDLVFSYRSTAKSNGGHVTSLKSNTLIIYTKKWVAAHQLKNDNGEALQVNVSRFRKTFENRIWELSGGDPFVTAALANHTVKVSDMHYLEAPADAEKNFNFMGKVRTDELLGNVKVIENNTPVSKCSDIPATDKNGNRIYCTDFLACVRCRNMVVTKEDLYRLFSFYWLIVYEREQIGAKRWSKYFAHIIRIIDRYIVPQFDAEYVQKIRDEAQANPHPAWKHRAQLEEVA